MNPVYFETRFRLSEPISDWPVEFAIISAFPRPGEIWTHEKSANADRELGSELRVRGAWVRRIEGYSPVSGHAEPSWAVELPFEEACELGLQFSQDAIYYLRAGVLYVTYCDSRRALVSVGPFAERVDSPSCQKTLASLLAYVRAEGRVCPQPQQWKALWEMLPGRERVACGWKPAVPLILGAWHHSSVLQKQQRLQEHIEYAAEHGMLGEVDAFLRGLPPEEWYTFVDSRED